jgi:RimJ/RimL family protein N-acetyltransferase
MPDGVRLYPFAIWWAFHYARIFSNRKYGVFSIFGDNLTIHRSCIFPGYFRFPFMHKDDLQIGDTWTSPDYQKQGLATFALKKICELFAKDGRTFWYVVEEGQYSSIRVVEKAGFSRVGEGFRTKRFGLSIFGSFVIEAKSFDSMLSSRNS